MRLPSLLLIAVVMLVWRCVPSTLAAAAVICDLLAGATNTRVKHQMLQGFAAGDGVAAANRGKRMVAERVAEGRHVLRHLLRRGAPLLLLLLLLLLVRVRLK